LGDGQKQEDNRNRRKGSGREAGSTLRPILWFSLGYTPPGRQSRIFEAVEILGFAQSPGRPCGQLLSMFIATELLIL
jgi:hypothetical protein